MSDLMTDVTQRAGGSFITVARLRFIRLWPAIVGLSCARTLLSLAHALCVYAGHCTYFDRRATSNAQRVGTVRPLQSRPTLIPLVCSNQKPCLALHRAYAVCLTQHHASQTPYTSPDCGIA